MDFNFAGDMKICGYPKFFSAALFGAALHATLLFSIAICLIVPTCGEENRANGVSRTLTIASEGARPPFNYLDNNELAGFEIEYGKDLCRRMHVSCKFVTQDWDSLIPGLLAHQYDAIMAAFEINDEAKIKIAFTEPYILMPPAMMTAKQNPLKDTSPKGMKGKAIGVVSGSTFEAYALAYYDLSDIRSFAALEDASLDLGEGRLDAVIDDKNAIMDFMKTRHEALCCELAATLPRDAFFFGAGIGIGLRKDDQGLKIAFDKAIDAAKADGTFKRLFVQNFGFAIDEGMKQ